MFLLKRDERNVDPLHWRHFGMGGRTLGLDEVKSAL